MSAPGLLHWKAGVGRAKGEPTWRGAVGRGGHRKAKARPSLGQVHAAARRPGSTQSSAQSSTGTLGVKAQAEETHRGTA